MSLAPFNPLHVPSVLRPVTVIERPPQTLSDAFGWIESLALVMVPFGYTFPFAAIQGLVDVLDQAYGNKIFVWVNVCFLLPGLPLAVFQNAYDLRFDSVFGSLLTFQVRMVIFSGVLVAVCGMLTWQRSEPAILVSSTLIGICCWGANGTCVQLVQMLGTTSTVLMQSGMQASCLSALVLVLAMQIHSHELESEKVSIYFAVATVFAFVGWLMWFALFGLTSTVFDRLTLRDQVLSSTSGDAPADHRPTLSPKKEENHQLLATGGDDTSFEAPAEHQTALRQLMAALFTTVFCSTLVGCFLGYISSDGTFSSISTVLVLSRLMCDVLSRPMIHLLSMCSMRPRFTQNTFSLLIATLVRAALMTVFFMYESDVFGKNDLFIIGFMCVFAFASGFLVVYSYVLAQEICEFLPMEHREIALAQSSVSMNMAFNSANFVGALIAIPIAYLL